MKALKKAFKRPGHGPAPAREAGSELPPFYALEAALVMRARTWRGLFFAAVSVLLAVVFGQQWLLGHKLFQKMDAEIVIVPGAPEFFRVRPGQVPEEAVFIFAEHVASNLGSFSHRNVKYHFQKIAEHMELKTKGRFETSFETRLKDWQERRVDQSFAYEPVRSFDLVTDERGPKYVTAVSGMRTQYVEGHQFSETRDVLMLEFRTRGNLTPEKPFIFEIETIEWMTPEQYEALRLAKGWSGASSKKGERS